jgi:pantoate--beta-alanine ligase
MEIIRIPRVMRDTCATAAQRGRAIGLVPTMGAIHGGHMSLVRTSRMENHITVVSVFVNPSQFGPGEDYERYPREAENDMRVLREADVDYLFIPDAEHMYPEGFCTGVRVGGLSEKLCGAFRPGHFDGVATVVAKLLNTTRPTRAYFGQKDYQQYLVIKRLARDLNVPVEIVMCPTIREEDGLAMRSRNRHLNPEERRAASAIYKSLSQAAEMIKTGYPTAEEVTELIMKPLESEPLITEVQYAGAYDLESLDELQELEGTTLLAVAVKLGDTRLIDNVLVREQAEKPQPPKTCRT